MVDKNKLIKIRKISLGTIGGVLMGGLPIAYTSCLEGYVDIPFHQDKYIGYEVTTKTFHIDEMVEGNNEVVDAGFEVLYLGEREINFLEAVTFKTYDQYRERVVKKNTREIAREENYYKYYMSSLTDDEIENIVNQFINGEFSEISDNADVTRHTYDIADNLTLEELDSDYYYSADLTINTVDYDNTTVLTENKDSYTLDVLNSFCLLFCASVGYVGGALCAYINTKGELDKETEKTKVKK